MANTMRLQIITPQRTILDEEIEFVVFTTTEGDMGVLYNHEPLVALLDYKKLVYTQGGHKKQVTALGGFVEVTKDKITVLTDASEFADEIDLDRARKAKERAEKRLGDQNMDQLRAEIALKKALARIDLAQKK